MVAIGNANTAIGQGSVAIGNTSRAAAAGSVALGDTAVANNVNDVALGSGSTTVAPHTGSYVLAGSATAAAGTAGTSGVVSVGWVGKERQIQNAGAGVLSATSTDAVNGSQLYATDQAIGTLAAEQTHYVSVNDGGTQGSNYNNDGATGTNSFAAGVGSVAQGPNDTAVGYNNQASANGSTAIGYGNTASGNNNLAVGTANQALNDGAVTVGISNTAGFNGNAFGAGNTASGFVSTALGYGNTASGTNSFAAGISNQATNFGASALGYDNSVSGARSAAVGADDVITSDNAYVLGSGVTIGTGLTGAVALGSGTVVAAPNTGITSLTGGSIAGTSPIAVVSIGAPGSERQLTNVAAGVLSATSTNAVNGSQLYDVASAVITTQSSVATALGGGAALNTNGTIGTAPSYTVQGNTYNNVGGAFAAVDNSLTTISGNVATNTANIATNTANIATNTANISNLSNELASGAVGPVQQTGTANQLALVAPGGTGAAPGAAQNLTNVAAGALNANSTDAVNGSQLYATNQAVAANTANIASTNANLTALGNSTAAILGGGSTYSASGGVSAPNYTVQGATVSGVGGAVTGLNTALTVTNANVTANTMAISAFANGAIGLVQQAGGSSAAVTVASVTGGTQVDFTGTDGTRTLTGVSQGDVSATSTDAVNGSQLYATNQAVATAQTIANTANTNALSALSGVNVLQSDLSSLASSAVTYDNATKSSVSFNASGAPVTLNNVAAGAVTATSTQAVNGSQLYATNQAIVAAAATAKSYTDQEVAGLASSVGQQFANVGASIDQLSAAVQTLRRDMNGGLASTAALAALPQSTKPGKFNLSMAVGERGGESGGAWGLSYRTSNDQATINARVATDRSATTAAVAFGVDF